MNQNTVIFADTPVGDGHEVVFLAEINSAFDSDLIEGKQMVEAAAQAGCHFLKAEILQSLDIVLNDGSCYEYAFGKDGEKNSECWYDIVARKMNDLSFYEELFTFSRKKGLEFIVSVYDIESVEFLASMNAAGIKIPSSNINHYPLITAAARTGIPLIFDTNKSYLGDIERALAWVQSAGSSLVVLNHHPGGGPAPAEVHNLRFMRFLKETFNVPIGLSCHYAGDEILYAAIGVGANLLEKPISFDPFKKDLDTIFAAHIDDLPTIMRKIRNCSSALGDGRPRQYSSNRHLDQRMGIVAHRDIALGETITMDVCHFSWPCKGISVEEWGKVEGRKMLRNVSSGSSIAWSDIILDD